MHFTTPTATLLTILALSSLIAATPVPAPAPIDYTPPGGWSSITYPKGTGENLPFYPPPPGGWASVTYPPGTGSSSSPFTFSSTYRIVATGAEVVNGTVPAPGPSEAVGFFEFGINGFYDTICYNITLLNIAGTYLSPAKTATHIHQALKGASGPPRLAFPNPTGDDKRRSSVGCMVGPFTTGINGSDGKDTGTGFRVDMIEMARGKGTFFADVHTNLFPLGVVRGQFA